MELDMKTIGKRIKDRRKELHLTQTDIKSAVGISSGNISDIENGNRLPAALTLVQLSSVLQCSIDWMLTGISPTKENTSTSFFGESDETTLLSGFRELEKEDKEELLEILQMKLRKAQRARGTSAKLSDLTGTENSDMVG